MGEMVSAVIFIHSPPPPPSSVIFRFDCILLPFLLACWIAYKACSAVGECFLLEGNQPLLFPFRSEISPGQLRGPLSA